MKEDPAMLVKTKNSQVTSPVHHASKIISGSNRKKFKKKKRSNIDLVTVTSLPMENHFQWRITSTKSHFIK